MTWPLSQDYNEVIQDPRQSFSDAELKTGEVVTKLWERYDNGDNLLFRQTDLQAPKGSPLFRELLAIRDPQAQMFVKELRRACEGSLTRVPLLTDLVPAEKPAGKVTKTVAVSSYVLQQLAEGPSTDWDFSDEEPSTTLFKKRRIKRRKRGREIKISVHEGIPCSIAGITHTAGKRWVR